MHNTERPELMLSPLQSGDEVAVVATSSALDNTENLLRGIAILSSWGLRIRPDVISQRRLAARVVAGFLGRDRTALCSHGSRCERGGPWALNHNPC